MVLVLISVKLRRSDILVDRRPQDQPTPPPEVPEALAEGTVEMV